MRRNQCDQTWQNFATLARFKKKIWTFFGGAFSIWQNLNLLWQILNTFGLIFIVVYGQTLKNNLAIWSQWALHMAAKKAIFCSSVPTGTFLHLSLSPIFIQASLLKVAQK